MIIKIIPKQVPVFWNAIKAATTQADEVDSKDLQSYLNELLQSLLSNKAQCFVALNEKRILVGLLITRVKEDKITKDKFLFMQSVYTWESLEDQIWRRAYDITRLFAIKEGCKYLSFNSRNPNVWSRTEKLGFKEITRIFSLKIV